MNNVDLIIRYLSGEMNPEEASAFERDLASDPALRTLHEEVSDAYRLISDQLQKRDEALFRSKLQEILEARSGKEPERSRHNRPRWTLLLPLAASLAASLAILLGLYLSKPSDSRLLSRYYKPLTDPVILAYSQESRGGAEQGITLYQNGFYHEAMQEMSQLFQKDPENQLALLYSLLASVELDLQDSVTSRITAMEINMDQQLGQSLAWYTTLALLKSGQKKEAETWARALTEQPGPYLRDARRLQKMLLK